ncbi:MAG: thiamine-phosphate kinase [Thermomicrobiales bacterium]
MSEVLRVRDVGEFGLIARLRQALPEPVRTSDDLILGIGDDAAVWEPTAGERVVITTDSLVEGIHFRTDWTDWRRLGHKVLAVNVSDLAAMGAAPKVAVVTLGLTGEESVNDLEELYGGMGELARRNRMVIAGGDIVRSPNCLSFHVTALGETRQHRMLTRAGARAGDIIGVTNTLGASAAGLHLLELPAGDPRRTAATADLLIDAHLRPEPRVAAGAVLSEGGASAAMDLSDGLLGDLPKILEASGVSAELDEARIPVPAAVRALFPEQWLALAERGGEDYELLFTIPADRWDELHGSLAAIGEDATAIGIIVPAQPTSVIRMIASDGTERIVAPGAFDHFEHV